MVPISWMMDLFIIRENFARKGPYRSFVSSRNSLLGNFVKVEQVLLTTFWRNFSKHSTRKCVSSNIFPCCSTQCGNGGNLLSCFFGKNFVKATHFLNKSLKSWFDGKNFGESKFFILLFAWNFQIHFSMELPTVFDI